MPYTVAQNEKGRWQVISPKGKTWKTTYASRAAADKGISYIEGRYGTPAPSARSPSKEPEMASTELPDDYLPPEGERGSRTLMRMRYAQDEEAF